ncbi:Asp-tRNA(Asn)/Glu-tRNA(Gln) amidotransferase subunit GatC [Treponema endosymbiont of Eucomonympha sp.]|uniref:Asp-tRNA(Asn)/Glu-tRNA(Gln) amidotransferase subunit GatC n=1 Tax=Treponema endosymbiont of Eucomonympha sp. TaxID=1580831 RepID=UPI000A4B64D8|nr:aspartyl/glutamyl-tRNA amidotransferase subunit C [Treponema endosymbiont of Eucomonympha sp.]
MGTKKDSAVKDARAIDEETLEALLYLSRLSPESVDLAALRGQVARIVAYFDILSAYDDSENPCDAYPAVGTEALRDDRAVKGLEIPDVKRMSGEFLDGYFRVPKVLGEGA